MRELRKSDGLEALCIYWLLSSMWPYESTRLPVGVEGRAAIRIRW